jgi:hypothetical protein
MASSGSRSAAAIAGSQQIVRHVERVVDTAEQLTRYVTDDLRRNARSRRRG